MLGRSWRCSSASRGTATQAGSAVAPSGRAIVRQPNVFLFDEPLSNLDADQLRARCAPRSRACTTSSAATTIYVTHDQVEAMTGPAHRVVQRGHIAGGAVVTLRPPSQPVRRPTTSARRMVEPGAGDGRSANDAPAAYACIARPRRRVRRATRRVTRRRRSPPRRPLGDRVELAWPLQALLESPLTWSNIGDATAGARELRRPGDADGSHLQGVVWLPAAAWRCAHDLSRSRLFGQARATRSSKRPDARRARPAHFTNANAFRAGLFRRGRSSCQCGRQRLQARLHVRTRT